MKRWSLSLQQRIQSSLLQACSLKMMQHSSSINLSKMLLHLILHANHAKSVRIVPRWVNQRKSGLNSAWSLEVAITEY